MRLGFAAALAAFCLGSAQAQQEPPLLPATPTEPREEPDVVPAQYTEPPPGVVQSGGAVTDPPTPVVRVQIRVPSAIAPKAVVKYTMTVRNVSAASAHKVRLRHKPPEGATQPTFEPKPDNWDGKAPLPAECLWQFKELSPGKSRLVTATYVAGEGVKELKAEAFVRFEHGEAVVTQVELPRLTLRRIAPTRAMAGEPIPMRVEVTNAGNVPVKNVKLLETLPADAEFRGEGEATKNPGQRAWDLNTLAPRQTRVVTYQAVAKGKGELLAISAVTGDGAVGDSSKESRTKIETVGVTVTLTGQARVEASGTGEYVATVTNTGTLPLSSVRLRAAIPEQCQATAMSAGGRLGRDEII